MRKLLKVREEERQKHENDARKREELLWNNQRFDDFDNRMNKAFADIDRRLTELEKRNAPVGDMEVLK